MWKNEASLADEGDAFIASLILNSGAPGFPISCCFILHHAQSPTLCSPSLTSFSKNSATFRALSPTALCGTLDSKPWRKRAEAKPSSTAPDTGQRRIGSMAFLSRRDAA